MVRCEVTFYISQGAYVCQIRCGECGSKKCDPRDILPARESDFLRYGYAIHNMLLGNHMQLAGGGFTFTGIPPIIQKISEAARKAPRERKKDKIDAAHA